MEKIKTSFALGNLFPVVEQQYKKFIFPGCNRIRVARLMGWTANNNYLGWQGYTGYSLLARMALNRRNSYVR